MREIDEFEARKIRRILSRLCFIREDLEAISRLELENEEMKSLVSRMIKQADELRRKALGDSGETSAEREGKNGS